MTRTYYIVNDENNNGIIVEDTGIGESYIKIEDSKTVSEFIEEVIKILNRLKNEGKLSRSQNQKAKDKIREFNQTEREEEFKNSDKVTENQEKSSEIEEKATLFADIQKEINFERQVAEGKKATGIELSQFEIEILHKYDTVCESAALALIMAEMESNDVNAAKGALMTMLSKRTNKNTRL